MACGVLSVVMVLLWIIFSRDSINCPEYENWKRAFLGGGYVPYESSKLVLILVLSAILSSSLKKVLFHKYEIPIFRKGLSSHPWRCIHWPEGWCSVGSPECQAEKQNLSGQFFWTMLHVLKLLLPPCIYLPLSQQVMDVNVSVVQRVISSSGNIFFLAGY